MSEQSHTTQFFKEGELLRADGVVLECTFVSYQERPKEGATTVEGQAPEVERYNFTYSFRPHEDMERERAETTPPAEAEVVDQAASAEENKPSTEGQGAY